MALGEHRVEIGGQSYIAAKSEEGELVLWPCGRCGGSGQWYYRSIYGVVCFACRGHRGVWQTRQQIEKRIAERSKRRARAEKKRIDQRRRWKMQGVEGAREYLANNPEVHAALRASGKDPRRDLAKNLVRWGKLSEKQAAFAIRLAQPKPPEAQKCDIPIVGHRAEMVGTVLSIKEVETPYGIQDKMLVEVACEEGVYRVFGTVPSAISRGVKRGSVVKFFATVQRKEFGFGFFSRPSKAEILAEEA